MSISLKRGRRRRPGEVRTEIGLQCATLSEESPHGLINPDPDSRLRGGGKKASYCTFENVPQRSSGLPDNHRIGLVGELGLECGKLRIDPSFLRGVNGQF